MAWDFNAAAATGTDLLRLAQERMRWPEEPVAGPWGVSISYFLRPYLHAPLSLTRHLDRFGGLEFAPHFVTFDSHRVQWVQVVQVRTVPLLDAITTAAVDTAADRIGGLLPPVPGKKLALDWLASKSTDLLLSLCLTALGDLGERALSVHVPTQVVYLRKGGRPKVLESSLFSSAVLALPQVNRSVLATAAAHGRQILVHPDHADHRERLYRAQMLHERISFHLGAARRKAATIDPGAAVAALAAQPPFPPQRPEYGRPYPDVGPQPGGGYGPPPGWR